MKCPKCGAEMREKTGRYGRFLGCSNYPRCNGTRDLKPSDKSAASNPTKRRARFLVIFPETISHTFRQRQPRHHQLSICRHDAEASDNSLLTCEALNSSFHD